MLKIDVTEAQFQAQVIELATANGWQWMHVERMGDRKGWRTPTKGTLRWWPDLTLCRNDRLVFAELKADRKLPKAEQLDVLRYLDAAGAEVYIWRPQDWNLILEVLT